MQFFRALIILPSIFVGLAQWVATFISISHEDLQAELDPDVRQKSPSKKAFETHANLMDGYIYHPYFWHAGKLNIMRPQDYGDRYIATNLVKLSYWFCSTYFSSGGSYNDMFSRIGEQILIVFMQLMFIAYLWFAMPPKKPPDPKLTVSSDAPKLLQSPSDVKSHELNKPRRLASFFGRQISSSVVCTYTKREIMALISRKSLALEEHVTNFILDTGSTDHICSVRSLFTGELKPTRGMSLNGIGGSIAVHGVGSISIRVTDDNGEAHSLILHNVLYVPDSPANLISPQKLTEGQDPTMALSAYCVTWNSTTVFAWANSAYSRTLHHRQEANLPILPTNVGMTKQTVLFCQPCSNASTYSRTPKCMRASVSAPEGGCPTGLKQPTAFNSEVMIGNPSDGYWEDGIWVPSPSDFVGDRWVKRPDPIIPWEAAHQGQSDPNYTPLLGPSVVVDDDDDEYEDPKDVADDDDPPTVSFDKNNVNDDVSEEEKEEEVFSVSEGVRLDTADISAASEGVSTDVEPSLNQLEELLEAVRSPVDDKAKEWLQIHHRMKHLSPKLMKRLAQRGIIPRKFAKYDHPKCPACIFGKQTCRPWRNPGRSKNKTGLRTKALFPGEQTHCDQIQSSHAGLIPQRKGNLMRARYTGISVFTDEASDFTYCHLMRSLCDEETLEAKHAYEHLMATKGVTVKRYHCDNGIYANDRYKNDCKDKNQEISFCGVGHHAQNGIAERRNREITEQARTSLSHGQRMWKEAVSSLLWPFAVKAFERTRNVYRLDDANLSPNERASRTKSKMDVRNEHTLFCPVYVLNAKLQGSIKGLPKWDPRSQTGVYVGMSPNHASSVALVLNLATGHVTPQYHVVFDDDFSTVQYLRTGERPPFWEELVRDNTEHFGIVDPTQRPSRDLDWSNLDWFEGAKVLAKKRQMDEVPEGDPVEGPTSILNEKTTRQQLAKKVRFIDEVDVKNAKKVQAGSGRRTELPISKETRVAPSAPNVHSEERDTAQETAQDISFEDNQPSSATDNILDIADLATAGLRRSGRSRKQKVIYDPSSSDGTFSKALAAISSLLTDHRSKVLMYTYYHRPRTKHIALKYHHFQSWIKSVKYIVLPIDTKEQIADQFTKGLGFQTFAYLRKQICGW